MGAAENYWEGAYDVENYWKAGLKPDPLYSVSEWSDQYRVLSSKSASESGKWRTSRTPYLKDPMDCLSSTSAVQRVVCMKGAQVGFTEAGNNFIGYVIHMTPGPMLAVSPTVELAKRNSKQRIDPLISDVPEIGERIAPARSRDSGNTVLSKEFPGGILIMTGANSAVGLRSIPAKFLFMDEVDGYPGDVDGEGDPILLAERRTATYKRRRKIFLVSTPTTRSTSRIQREFDKSDQRYFFVPCPFCGKKQIIKMENLRWPEGKPQEVQLECEHCQELISEYYKTEMLSKGEWIATAEGDGITRGYHLSSLYSPVGWFGWDEAAQMFEEAQNDPDLMKGFMNTVLGESYEDEYDAPEWERLYERREEYLMGTVPKDGVFLTSGVDVQQNRLEVETVAWTKNGKESYSVDYTVLEGNTAEQKVWDQLKEYLERDWPHALGGTLPIRVMCVDSGYATQDVYTWVSQFPQASWTTAGARANQPRTVVAVKGRDTETALISNVSKVDLAGKRGVRVWSIGTPVVKGELYRWLKLSRPTDEDLAAGENFAPGTCHFPEYGEEYFKQLTAEKRVIKLQKGFPKAVWEKDPTRNNEALDCRIYARAAASIYGLDRFKEVQWKRLEKSLTIARDAPVKVIQDRKDATNKDKPREKSKSHYLLSKRQKISTSDDPYL